MENQYEEYVILSVLHEEEWQPWSNISNSQGVWDGLTKGFKAVQGISLKHDFFFRTDFELIVNGQVRVLDHWYLYSGMFLTELDESRVLNSIEEQFTFEYNE